MPVDIASDLDKSLQLQRLFQGFICLHAMCTWKQAELRYAFL